VTAPRINLLLNNPFVTDSRSWKIAHSMAGAGWQVTVIAIRRSLARRVAKSN